MKSSGTVYWTTYTYDALGRTLTVALPSSMGTTTYLYEGNTVKTTDAAGKWKKFTMNALGQLTKVTEPQPGGGTDYDSTYTYDIWGNLTGVSMPRGATTQTRTFTYNSTGQMLTSVLLRIPPKGNADSEGNANGIPGRRRTEIGA